MRIYFESMPQIGTERRKIMKLKDIRKEYGFTQETIAKLLSVNRSTYAHWESERRTVPAYIQQRIKRLFDVDGAQEAKRLRAERLVEKITKGDV